MGKYKRTPDGRTIKRNSHRIGGQFTWRLIDMLESPAYRVLSLAEHRLLARIEIELAHHGGLENGSLIVTYEQFAAYGVRLQSVAPARRALEALGFIQTRPGRGGNSEFYQPNRFRLTYQRVQAVRYQESTEPTDDWRRIKTIEEARRLAKTARAEKTDVRPRKRKKQRAGKQKSAVRNGGGGNTATVVEMGGSALPNRTVHPHYRNAKHFLDDSGGGGGDDGGEVLNSLPASAVLPSEGCRDGPAPSVAQGQHRAAADLEPTSALVARDEITAGSSTVVPFSYRRAGP
jgi:hypothetical protein